MTALEANLISLENVFNAQLGTLNANFAEANRNNGVLLRSLIEKNQHSDARYERFMNKILIWISTITAAIIAWATYVGPTKI